MFSLTHIKHHDLATYRNLMVGDCQIEGDVIVDAVPYVIDFGKSVIKVNPSPAQDGEMIAHQLRSDDLGT